MVQRWNQEPRVLPAVLMIVGLMMMAISFIFASTSGTQSGMWMDHVAGTMTSYTAANLLIAIVGSFLFASGLMYLLLRQDYEPMLQPVMPTASSTGFPSVAGTPLRTASDTAVRSEPQAGIGRDTVEQQMATFQPATPSVPSASAPDDAHQPSCYLALRLLSGDEKTMFKAIMDSGGEALQKDLILKTKMSDAKASRVIDRLEEKGVVTKMRFGMTNKVSIELEH